MDIGSIQNADGIFVIRAMIRAIHENARTLSEIDRAIGDGDHGVNMDKGFTLCEKRLNEQGGSLTDGLNMLSAVLMDEIGGSMGPLYGLFFSAMAEKCEGKAELSAAVFGDMLAAAEEEVYAVGGAKVGEGQGL